MKDLPQKARTAVEQGKLAEAASLLGKLRELDPLNLELAEVQALMQSGGKMYWKRSRRSKKRPPPLRKARREQLRLYEQALVLLPGDPELLELKAQANKALINEAIAATEAELDLGFDTPGELEQGKLAPDGRVLVKGVQANGSRSTKRQLQPSGNPIPRSLAASRRKSCREFIATRAGEKRTAKETG